MSMLFQHLLFISFKTHHTEAHVQHHEYIKHLQYIQYVTISYQASQN